MGLTTNLKVVVLLSLCFVVIVLSLKWRAQVPCVRHKFYLVLHFLSIKGGVFWYDFFVTTTLVQLSQFLKKLVRAPENLPVEGLRARDQLGPSKSPEEHPFRVGEQHGCERPPAMPGAPPQRGRCSGRSYALLLFLLHLTRISSDDASLGTISALARVRAGSTEPRNTGIPVGPVKSLTGERIHPFLVPLLLSKYPFS